MFSFIQSVVITVLLAFLLRVFVVQPFVVDGSSMEPNFHNNEYIIIDKLSYRFHNPKRGDVIVLHPPVAVAENYIKRIIGLPGETVSVENGDVFINGQKIDEPYLGDENHKTTPFNMSGPVTLGPNDYYVMGDNREHSSDSRDWGILNRSEIEGRTWFVVFPLSNFSFIHTPTYSPAQ
jgi:signal peptidase I